MMIATIYLVILGIRDFRKLQVPVWWLMIGTILLPGMGVYKFLLGEMQWMEMFLGMITGLPFLLVARLSGMVGYADGVVLVQLGLYQGYGENVVLLSLSLLLLSAISMILLLAHKVNRGTKMPYLSCVAIAFMLLRICVG